MREKRELPSARCTVCGKVVFIPMAIDLRCGVTYGGKRCKGTNRSAICVGDWIACLACDATGWNGQTRCAHCDGDGWLYNRDKRT